MFKKIIPIFILLIAFSIAAFNIDSINSFKNQNSKLLVIDDTIDSFKFQTNIKQIC